MLRLGVVRSNQHQSKERSNHPCSTPRPGCVGTHRDIPPEHGRTCWAPPAGYGHLHLLVRLDLTASFVHRLSPVGAVTHGFAVNRTSPGGRPCLSAVTPRYVLELEPDRAMPGAPCNLILWHGPSGGNCSRMRYLLSCWQLGRTCIRARNVSTFPTLTLFLVFDVSVHLVPLDQVTSLTPIGLAQLP